MIRDYLRRNVHDGEPDFHWRGKEITRLEGFSDAVFAFAVTLLVVSLEVPRTFPELMRTMRGFIPFAICFALLINIWSQHYRFFRRYGLEDSNVRLLNSILLFFVLFYVYPLKFLFVTVFEEQGQISDLEMRELFIVYGLGFAALQTIFCLLYLRVIVHRVALDLTPLELMSTRETLFHHVITGTVGIVSVLVALSLPLNLVGIAGLVYSLLVPYFWISKRIFRRRKRALQSH
jgi:uncharacterized membrane protein